MTSWNSRTLKRHVRRIVIDLVLIPLAFYLALLIRLDGRFAIQELETMSRAVLPIVSIYVLTNLAFGIYRRLWVYASFRDVILLSETIGLATLVVVVVNAYVFNRHFQHTLSAGCLVMGGILTLILSTVVRYRRQLVGILVARFSKSTGTSRERVLIVGLNEAAQQLATRIYMGESRLNYELVGFVDDDPDGAGMNVNGIEILGVLEHIPRLVKDKEIDIIIIARQFANREAMWKLISICQETPAQIKVLPDMAQVVSGNYRDPFALRDVSFHDILGRAPVSVDVEACQQNLAGKVVLVTGAAGSIGSELCRQILRFEPQLLVAVDNNETGLYELNLELNRHGQASLQLSITDVTDWLKVDRVFELYKPQVVFHAAAYKHVPLMETCPDESLRVNVMGTIIISEMARRHAAERFVFISTDKAVNPSCVMGASKRIGELWLKGLAVCSDTTFIVVRFGNVIGSRGSVLPRFARQIELGGPVTVTHPDMTRFFMSIPDAVSLVLQSSTFSQSGGVFMLEMGEEVSILDLAKRMIRLRGQRVNKDIQIEYTGIRPGEKLHEELSYGQESINKTSHPSIYRLQGHDSVPDCDILLGALAILAHSLQGVGAAQLTHVQHQVRDGIFQIADGDIDGFLYHVTGLDFMAGKRRLIADQNEMGGTGADTECRADAGLRVDR
ncbi:MAG: polysaccharide biosynthesis protein, partial [Anaerolineae bacterium]|nr:polysaccharide biosynthesis protein [Anaerolineae bacterium]